MRALALCLLIGAVSAAAWSADWPQFRGPNADGISPDTGINKDWKAKPPKELWQIALSDNGFAGPSVAGGRLYIVDKDGDQDWVRAIDIKTGKDIWGFKYADNYAPQDVLWGRGRSTPVFDNGMLYTQGPSGRLHCLNATDGKLLWKHDLKEDFGGNPGDWAYTAAPLVDGNNLIVCPGGKDTAVAALDKISGKNVWVGGGSDRAGYGTPVIAMLDGKKQYVVFTGWSLIGVDAANGKQVWSIPWKTSYDVNAATPIVMGKHVFITSGYGKGCGLVEVSGNSAKMVWENKEIKAHFNTPVLIGGHLYGIGDNAGLVCLDPKTGAKVWNQTGFEKGGVLGIDGALIAVVGNTGDTVLIDPSPAGYKELARIKPVQGRTWTSPIAVDKKLYIRDMKKLVCLDLN